MELTRRQFFQLAGAVTIVATTYEFVRQSPALAGEPEAGWKLIDVKETPTICCYCGCGCGCIVSVRDGELINVEGDPDHPVNRGALCAKGSAQFGIHSVYDPDTGKKIPNPNRLTKPMVRRPGSGSWEELSWEQAIDEISSRLKATRDANYEDVADGVTVNRCEAIASLGAAALDTEECYAVQKLMRGLGVTFLEHQARVCHSSTVSGLGGTFGRGAMTNHFCDLKNADVVLAIGSNNAMNHPMTMKWVEEARARGGKYIVVDPRFNRSAAVADMYAPLRAGSDIAFFGGLVNHIIEHGLWQKEYVAQYTTAPFLVSPDYTFDEATGLFSGWDDETHAYDPATWAYQIASEEPWDTSPTGPYAWSTMPGVPTFAPRVAAIPKTDPTMRDPDCVWQLLRKHYARYTPDMVSRVTGCPEEQLIEVWDAFAASGKPEKSGTILYAMGQTQHTNGSQNVRAMGVVQTLLGNLGVAGGGINALRGESNVQGSTDAALLCHIVPGYMASPVAAKHPDLQAWLEAETPATSYWSNKPKFFVSLLKELYGAYATVKNDYAYDMLPKLSAENHTVIGMFEAMDKGVVKGMMLWGQNPAVSSPNAVFARAAMAKLEWLVAVDLWETESACFWKAPGVDPAAVQTEVFMLPAAAHYEKQGSVSNSGRWIQWRWKAVDPPGEARDDLEIVHELCKALKTKYRKDGGPNREQLTKLHWPYESDGHADVTKIARGMNGYTVADGMLIPSFAALAADGSTACGLWIYAGYYANNEAPDDPTKQATGTRDASADPGDLGLYPRWTWAWPLNRRIIYNRASADIRGRPWNRARTLVAWNGSEWKNNDVPDFLWKVVLPDGTDEMVPPNNKAFIMTPELGARFFSTSMKDGPFPEHYEPFESPVANLLNGSQSDPALTFGGAASVKPGDPAQYPIVCTTFRLTEHWQAGAMTRNIPWLVEAIPRMFVQLSEELAEEKQITDGDWVRIFNNRGAVEVYAMVTPRLKPLKVDGKSVHQIGMPWHWGYASGLATGAIANDLSPNVGDANTSIPEYKAFLVDVEKA
jgi:formate dehydrogenase major subunit